jgi:hypothetical protein
MKFCFPLEIAVQNFTGRLFAFRTGAPVGRIRLKRWWILWLPSRDGSRLPETSPRGAARPRPRETGRLFLEPKQSPLICGTRPVDATLCGDNATLYGEKDRGLNGIYLNKPRCDSEIDRKSLNISSNQSNYSK